MFATQHVYALRYATGENNIYSMIFDSTNNVIYAGSGPDFGEAARRETDELRKEINRYR